MRQIIISILLILAVFFSLFPHRVHEKVIKDLTGMPSPPHFIHLVIGLSCFFLATILAQKDYFDDLYAMGTVAAEKFTDIKQVAGAIVNKASNNIQIMADNAYPRASRIANKAIHKIPSMSKVADSIENFVDRVEINI